jgi:hypothetical protein
MAMPSRKAEARPDRESHEHPYGANRGVLCEIAIADHFQEILPDIGRRGQNLLRQPALRRGDRPDNQNRERHDGGDRKRPHSVQRYGEDGASIS